MIEVLKNRTVTELQLTFERMQNVPNLVAREVTFTINPSVTGGLQEAKKNVMYWVIKKLDYLKDKGLRGFIMTRENHENGWPHVHGIVWFHKENDNSLMLARPIEMIQKTPGSKFSKKVILVPQIGRTWIDPLRINDYEKDGVIFNGWFDYIMKEQHIKWREANLVYENVLIEDYYKIVKTTDYVD